MNANQTITSTLCGHINLASKVFNSKVLTEYMEFLYFIETLGSVYNSCTVPGSSAQQGRDSWSPVPTIDEGRGRCRLSVT